MPYLVVMDGPQKGRRFAITDDATRIGRIAGNHIVLDNASVSSCHAEITKSSEGVRLRDLDSTNGTRVNGMRTTDTKLNNGDQVEILTSNKQQPNEDWLGYAVTAKARSVIKQALKEEKKKKSSPPMANEKRIS